MKLYDSYIKNIEKAINLSDFNTHFPNHLSGRDIIKGELSDSQTLEPKTGLETLAGLLGINEIKEPVLGDHPDFSYLRHTGGTENHYIVSMFIDVKGSTNFHKRYNLDQIAVIIQTIVTAATHTCALFGGHIQRLQYDGVFCYFGGKGVDRKTAVKSAVDTASFFSYFIKYELKGLFQLESIENIYTRIGIDYGEDEKVQWRIFGSGQCTELTTNSLHTSLAPKMQANAPSNGIMIGDYVKQKLGALEIYCDNLRMDNGNVDENNRYIYKDSNKPFYYAQWKFGWIEYLKTYGFITSVDGELVINYNQSSTKTAIENDRRSRLYEKAVTINSGTAFITPEKRLSKEKTDIKSPDHHFYYDTNKF